MAVEVNHRHGAIGTVDGAQQRQGDGVVTAEGDDTGESAALDGRASLVSVSGRRAGQEVEMTLLDLLQRPGVVISGCVSLVNDLLADAVYDLRRDGDVTTVEDGGPAVEGVRGERHIVATTGHGQHYLLGGGH